MAWITDGCGQSLDKVDKAAQEKILKEGGIIVRLGINDAYHYYVMDEAEKIIGMVQDARFAIEWEAVRYRKEGRWSGWQIIINAHCVDAIYNAVEAFLEQLKIVSAKIE